MPYLFVLLLLHSGFVLSVLNIIHVLDLESVWFQTFIQHITLDMFYILFIVIVGSWNVNKISISMHLTFYGLITWHSTHASYEDRPWALKLPKYTFWNICIKLHYHSLSPITVSYLLYKCSRTRMESCKIYDEGHCIQCPT